MRISNLSSCKRHRNVDHCSALENETRISFDNIASSPYRAPEGNMCQHAHSLMSSQCDSKKETCNQQKINLTKQNKVFTTDHWPCSSFRAHSHYSFRSTLVEDNTLRRNLYVYCRSTEQHSSTLIVAFNWYGMTSYWCSMVTLGPDGTVVERKVV